MTTTTIPDQNLKQDSRGRVRMPAERREALLDEFERSGLSGAKFAEMVGVKYPTLANWVQKRRKAREESLARGSAQRTGEAEAQADGVEASDSRPVRLFEAVVTEEPRNQAVVSRVGGLLIEWPGGGRMQVESPAQLRLAAELLGILAESPRKAC